MDSSRKKNFNRGRRVERIKACNENRFQLCMSDDDDALTLTPLDDNQKYISSGRFLWEKPQSTEKPSKQIVIEARARRREKLKDERSDWNTEKNMTK